MRLLAVSLLGILVLSATAAPGLAAPPSLALKAVEAPSTAGGCRVVQEFPADRPWSGVFLIGYISIGLKSQLRRRGFLDGPRGRTFTGLISLPRQPAPRPAAPHDSDRRAGDGRVSP